MKTELDFSKVPLDKWVELYNETSYIVHMMPDAKKRFDDVTQWATVQVKEESDFDKEIADACLAYFEMPHDTDKYIVLSRLMDARKLVVKEDKEDKEVHSKLDLSDIPF